MTMEYRTAYRIKKARREAELNRQRRRVILGLAAALIFVWLAVFGAPSLHSTEAAGSNSITVTVRNGDTLWSLAAEYKPDDEEIRRFVRTVAAYNSIDDMLIYEGQTLIIPQ